MLDSAKSFTSGSLLDTARKSGSLLTSAMRHASTTPGERPIAAGFAPGNRIGPPPALQSTFGISEFLSFCIRQVAAHGAVECDYLRVILRVPRRLRLPAQASETYLLRVLRSVTGLLFFDFLIRTGISSKEWYGICLQKIGHAKNDLLNIFPRTGLPHRRGSLGPPRAHRPPHNLIESKIV